MEHLSKHEELVSRTLKYFFSNERFSSNSPFKGFILHGPVGTGKTELVKQAARKVAIELKDRAEVTLIPIDAAVIASPKWGESEAIMQALFEEVKHSISGKAKSVLLFDDIESLLLSRGMQTAREWHYSLNSVLFHLLDNINPFYNVVFATTNREDLLDEAISSRLYSVAVSSVPIEQLLRYSKQMLESIIGPGHERENEIIADVKSKLASLEVPTIRDCRQSVIVSMIERGILE